MLGIRVQLQSFDSVGKCASKTAQLVEEPFVLLTPLLIVRRIEVGARHDDSTPLFVVQSLPIERAAEVCLNRSAIGFKEIERLLGLLGSRAPDVNPNTDLVITEYNDSRQRKP